jgi:predicted O-linked N-acetylglucosamine transferase (SPINDLY family)
MKAQALFIQAVTLHQQGRLGEAQALYETLLKSNARHADALHLLGVVAAQAGNHQRAADLIAKAIAINPGNAGYYSNRGTALLALKQYEAAIGCYDQAIRIQPDFADAYGNRGNALQSLKQLDAAVASYDRAIRLKPDYVEAYSNRGNALQALKQYEAAIASYDQAIRIRPDHADAHHNRGNALHGFKQLEAAIVSYSNALKIKPDYDYLFGLLLNTRMWVCDWTGYEEQIAGLKARIERGMKCSSCFTVLTLIDLPAIQRKAAEIWVADKHPASDVLGSIPKRARSPKIRIGYYSADFHNHATTFLMAGLLELHDRSRFELIGFSFGPDRQDEMRQRVCAAFDQFIDVREKSDEEVAQLSRSWNVDIAVDLKGFTEDSRNGIFSYRAAPVQVSYLGYPGTVGAPYMDYLIADRTLVPERSQQHYSEKIVYLPGSYQVNDRKRRISERIYTRAEVGLPEQGFVFCCFNNNYKITPVMFDSWVRILNAVPGSVLWLFEDNATAATNLRKEAEQRGLHTTRLVFAKRMELSEHLARHRLADLFLDTLPCNAHTTASDALWAGLPVLTQAGESFAARVAASLLNAVGLPELITETQEQYESLAIELAHDPARLSALKEKLQKNRLTAPLFDTDLYTRNLEAAYSAMYERYQADLPPEHVYLSDQKDQK